MAILNCVEYDHLLTEIADGVDSWSILTAINFEECSTKLCKDILTRLKAQDSNRVRLLPIRLVSRRASPWSSLELVKEQFQREVQQLALACGIEIKVRQVEYPAGHEIAFELLASAQGDGGHRPNLILDTSSLPRELVVFLCDAVCGLAQLPLRLSFSKIFVLQTPPDRITSRQGLGPFSVGGTRCVYYPDLIRYQRSFQKTSLLIFPGYEGFEAKVAVDAVAGHDSVTSVAISHFEDLSFPSAHNVMIANQSLFTDEIEGVLDIQYYFSELDSLRVALDLVERAVNLCAEFPGYVHAFLVAPFGPKWSLLMSTIARKEFHRRSAQRVPDALTISDVLILPTSQYVSLYSRGARTPCVFALNLER
jgi:hypothetical protein